MTQRAVLASNAKFFESSLQVLTIAEDARRAEAPDDKRTTATGLKNSLVLYLSETNPRIMVPEGSCAGWIVHFFFDYTINLCFT
jgi:hypothetical protein